MKMNIILFVPLRAIQKDSQPKMVESLLNKIIF